MRSFDRRSLLAALIVTPAGLASARAALAAAPADWDMEVDFVNLGAGVGGLSGAVVAHDMGMSSIVLEKTAKVGGVAALSLGQLWVPGNHLAAAAGLKDDWRAGFEYLTWMGAGHSRPALAEAFCRHSPEVLKYFEDKADVRWILFPDYPDYFYPMGRGSVPAGRYIEVAPLEGTALGDWAPLTRRGRSSLLTNDEARKPPAGLAARRETTDARAMGAGLGAYLLRAVLRRGVPVLTEVEVKDLISEDGRVVGLTARHEGRSIRIRARKGILIATSGYDWDPALTSSFDARRGGASMTQPAVAGDHLRLAGLLGAQVLSISARPQWIGLGYREPGEVDAEGIPAWRGITTRVPHIIMVNRKGRRFCDESWGPSYVAALSHTDIESPGLANQPFWAIFDKTYLAKHPMRRSALDSSLPSMVIQAPNLRELASRVGIDPDGLVDQVKRFNADAVRGRDLEYGRGTRPQGLANGDPDHKPNPNLGPVDSGPFYAIPLEAASIGIPTAGLVGDEDARVLDWRERPIPGLYVTGNSMVMLDLGLGYNSGIANTRGMVYAWLAARHAARN